MDALPPAHRAGIGAALWRRVVNAGANANAVTVGEGTPRGVAAHTPLRQDSIASSTSAATHGGGAPIGGTADPAYLVKFCTIGGSYSCLALDEAYATVYVGYMDEMAMVDTIAAQLTQFRVAPESLCGLLRRALCGGDEEGGGGAPSVAFRRVGDDAASEAPDATNASSLLMTITSSVSLSGHASVLPLRWTVRLNRVPAIAAQSVVAALIVSPLLGVCAALSYSYGVFQTTILAKDRELKAYRDTYGAVTGIKKPSPPLFPEQYHASLMASAEVLSRLHAAGLGALGDPASGRTAAAAHMNLAPHLYQLYMRTSGGEPTASEAAAPGVRGAGPRADAAGAAVLDNHDDDDDNDEREDAMRLAAFSPPAAQAGGHAQPQPRAEVQQGASAPPLPQGATAGTGPAAPPTASGGAAGAGSATGGAVGNPAHPTLSGIKRTLESYEETEDERRRRDELTQLRATQTQRSGGGGAGGDGDAKKATKAEAERAKQKKLRKMFK